MRRSPAQQVAEVGRVDDDPIAQLDQLVEDRVAEGRVARPPDVGRQIVDQQRATRSRPGDRPPRRARSARPPRSRPARRRSVAVVAVRADARVDRRAIRRADRARGRSRGTDGARRGRRRVWTTRSAAASSTTVTIRLRTDARACGSPFSVTRAAPPRRRRLRVPQRREVAATARTVVPRSSHIGVARLCVLAEAHEAPMDRLLLRRRRSRSAHGRRHARPSRSSSSSAAGGPQVPAA